MLTALLLTVQAAATPPVMTPPPEPRRCRGEVCIVDNDLTPKFLAFWDAARAEAPADAEARFRLWQRSYGFAAVPPGPRGEAMARQLLEGAWPKYAAAIPTIRTATARWSPDPAETLAAVARTLGWTQPISVRLTRFVGGFEDNAFTSGGPGKAAVFLPVETDSDKALLQAHELAHAVHMSTANLPGGWERSIAQTAFMEGIAMHTARAVAPGRPVDAYISAEPGWWPKAQANRRAILSGVRGALAAKDGETVWRFTIGEGSTGLQREAYAAGWWIVERLRADGMSLARIAAVPEPEMHALATKAIDAMLAETVQPATGSLTAPSPSRSSGP